MMKYVLSWKPPLQQQEITNDEWEGVNDAMRSFKNQFIHDEGHRRVPLPVKNQPLPVQDAEPAPVVPVQPIDPPPTEAPSSFFILGVSDVLDVLDGLMGLCFFCVSVST